MSRSKKTRAVLVADFETTTDPEDCRVWGYGISNVLEPETVFIDNSIQSFIDKISSTNSITYFHNLKFDGSFILYWLLTNDYEHTTEDRAPSGTFSTLISDKGFYYSITVRWKNGHSTEFRDSFKKLPMSVSRVAKSFGYDEGKGEIDYKKYRPIGYVITAEERDYIRRDVSIIAKAIKQVHVDNGMKRLTVGSDSLAEYKNLAPSRFDQLFPVLSHAMDADIRSAYRGGFTYADERFRGRRQGRGLVLDVNSLYPYIMRERMIPYGEPKRALGKPVTTREHPLAIFSVTFTASLKPNHIPCIQIKGSSRFTPTEYVREIDEPVTLMVTTVDWELYNKHYDIDVYSYDGGYLFHAAKGLFNDYIDKWSRVKAHSKHGIREIAKLHLNSLYGKLASNPNITGKVPTLQNDVVKLVRGAEEVRDPVYTAAGVFITSWARELTISAAQQNYDVFAYADTDSLHLLTDKIPDNIRVHKSDLGAWKLEYIFGSALYIRSKAYMEQLADGEMINRIAGIPEHLSANLKFSDLDTGVVVVKDKLIPKPVPGGVVLTETEYELKMEPPTHTL